jgi:Carboxypeptidase regulatory-like domain
MRGLGRMLVALAITVVVPAVAYAQASISGTVKDASGAVLPGATIEAASDVLIEKVRTTTTDSAGRYQIIDLRPGQYVVTFTLTGFSTIKRDGVVLSGTGNTNIDADLKVGAVAETITVTGETPLVDITSTKRESVIDHDTVQNLPSSRQYFTLARMIPGTSGGGTDVGGSGNAGASGIADVGQSLTVHGSKNVDQRIMLNGVSIMTLQAGGNIGGQQPDVGSAAEIAVDTSSLSAEGATGGLRINFIPKDGGNTFGNSTFFTFANQSMQGNNYTDALKAAGLATPTQIDFVYDVNESLGGPIKKDKIWFWFSTRYNKSANYAGIFQNLNAYNPNLWTYVPDPANPAENKGTVQQNNLRLTFQVNPKLKIAAEQKVDTWCNCPNNVSATVAPEAARDRRFPRLRQEHVEFTSPITSRLLLEGVGMHLFERWGNMDLRGTDNGGSLTDPAQIAAQPSMISVVEQSTGLTYRNGAAPCCASFYNNTLVPNYTYRVAATYVTGTHAIKAGWNDTFGYLNAQFYNFNPIGYTFLNGQPSSLTETIMPYPTNQEENHDFGMFVQDNWKLNRLSVIGAIRYDWFKSSFPEQHLGPGSALVGLANRNITFPEQDDLNWKDISYRSGIVWDARGDGKTAVRLAANKYLLGQTLNGLGTNPNPILTLQTNTSRSWADSNKNFVPDCNLANPAAQNLTAVGGDNCGAIAQSAFGSTTKAAVYDPDVLTGWGHRPANWEFSAGVQQQLPGRMSVDISYFRRIWENFEVVDNSDVAANEFQAFNMTVPTDPRLPTSGQQLTYYNVVPAKLGAQTLYHSLSDKYGSQYEHWNGLDIVVNGRLQNGLRFQAGVSTGRSTADNCAVVAALPEMLTFGSVNAAGPLNAPGTSIAQQFCHEAEPWLTTFKAFESYTVPKIDVQVAATFRSVPGISGGGNSIASGLAANFVATNAYLATNSNLGRLLTGTTAATQSVTLNIVDPASVYLDRDNELDLRFGKVVRYRALRGTINLDLFNALNKSTILTANAAYALANNVWSAPTLITNPRLLKVSFTLDIR